MSRPEASDNVSDYAPRGGSEFYRHGRAGAAIGEGPKGDLSRLRQSLGPEPEVVHVPQPTRRVGWFASGFAIALVVGIVAGWLVISQFPSLTGKGSGSSTKTAELAPSKSPEEANAPGAGIANAGPRAFQSSAPSAAVPAAPATPQPASSAPARVATAEPASVVRGVTDTEIRFGISAPFSGPAKELGQTMKLGIEAAFSAANATGGVFGRKLRLVAADDGYEPPAPPAPWRSSTTRIKSLGWSAMSARQRR
jgi:Periplasmic binding protein